LAGDDGVTAVAWMLRGTVEHRRLAAPARQRDDGTCAWCETHRLDDDARGQGVHVLPFEKARHAPQSPLSLHPRSHERGSYPRFRAVLAGYSLTDRAAASRLNPQKYS